MVNYFGQSDKHRHISCLFFPVALCRFVPMYRQRHSCTRYGSEAICEKMFLLNLVINNVVAVAVVQNRSKSHNNSGMPVVYHKIIVIQDFFLHLYLLAPSVSFLASRLVGCLVGYLLGRFVGSSCTQIHTNYP